MELQPLAEPALRGLLQRQLELLDDINSFGDVLPAGSIMQDTAASRDVAALLAFVRRRADFAARRKRRLLTCDGVQLGRCPATVGRTRPCSWAAGLEA